MTDSTEVATTSGGVPALATTPALEIGVEDVALPRVYLGQYMSKQVQEGNVPVGAIFTALGEDDPAPNVLYEADDDAGVIVHVLGMKRGKSVSKDGELELFAYDDPAAPPEAWTTYNYVVALPEVDADVPYKWLLTRTNTQAAKQINFVLSKNAAAGPPWNTAFEVKTSFRENNKGKFYVAQIAPAEATADNITAAEKLAVMVSGDSAEYNSTQSEPDI